jgi:hypothetical protein
VTKGLKKSNHRKVWKLLKNKIRCDSWMEIMHIDRNTYRARTSKFLRITWRKLLLEVPMSLLKKSGKKGLKIRTSEKRRVKKRKGVWMSEWHYWKKEGKYKTDFIDTVKEAPKFVRCYFSYLVDRILTLWRGCLVSLPSKQIFCCKFPSSFHAVWYWTVRSIMCGRDCFEWFYS